MQGRGGGGDPFFDFHDPFAGFGPIGGFGGVGGSRAPRSFLSSFFGGRDPFEDTFFRNPFGDMHESSFFSLGGSPFANMHQPAFIEHQPLEPERSRGPIIEELNSDDEKEQEGSDKKGNPRKHGRSSSSPYVEDPDEAAARRSRHLQHGSGNNRFNEMQSHPQAHNFIFQSSTITRGGANGAYYTSSKMRRTGSDGMTFEESKEADTTTRQATHRISKSLHNKGHSISRKLNSDGRVDSMQTLHNLNEDELTGFEEAWSGNARKHLPGWSGSFTTLDGMGVGGSRQNGQASGGGWALPFPGHSQQTRKMKPEK